MDGFTPGWGAGGCCCEMDGCACESCAMGGCGGGARHSCATWREHYNWNHTSDDKKQFLVVASGDFRHSLRIRQEIGGHLRNMITESEPVKLEAPNGHVYQVEVRMEVGDVVLRSGWHKFVDEHKIEKNFSILFMYRGDSTFKVQIFDSAGQERSLSCSQLPSGIFVAVPPRAPCDHHVLKEQVVPDPGHVQNSTDFVYTTLPGCRLTKAQDEKVLEIADNVKSEIPLHVAAMNKRNIKLKDSCVYIPLQLVLDHFKDKITITTIQLEAPDKNVYSVGASKHNDDQIVINSEWDTFVASNQIQENDLLIFRSTEKSRLEVLILDPNGREKTSSCSVMGNRSSTAQETCDDSVQIVDPPPPQIIDVSISDEDDIMREGTRESCRAQKRVTRSCAKAQKLASTSSPYTKSGYKAHKPHDRASVKLGANNLGGPSQRPYMLTKGATLPMQVEKKVEALVQEIQSELPIFVRVMTINTVRPIGTFPCQMYFGVEYASACLPRKIHTLHLQLEGKKKQWQTTLDVRNNDKTSRITIGWKEFAGENGLEVGDICLFQLVDTNSSSLNMKVHLIRKSEIEP